MPLGKSGFSSSQSRKIKQLKGVVGDNISEDLAAQILRTNDWDVNSALNYYFTNPGLIATDLGFGGQYRSSHQSKPDLENNIRKIFQKYEDPESKHGSKFIGLEGVCELCDDLHIDPETDRTALLLAWKLSAKEQGRFSYDEFKEGLKSMGVSTIGELGSRLQEIDDTIDDNRNEFKSLYKFTFAYGKEKQFKSLSIDTAIAYWKILFQRQDKTFYLLGDWLQFCQERMPDANRRPDEPQPSDSLEIVTHDQWDMLVDFADISRTVLKDYDEMAAWPTLIDDFVLWYRQKAEMSVS